jgi:predicted transposase YbfD/YdcC
VVTIDAMGCQRDIASKIIEKKADDYIIALKVNQSTLRDDVAVFVDEQKPLNTGIPVRTKPSMPITAVSRP